MAAFAYKALNQSGRNKNGVLEGDNARQIRAQLRDMGLIPLEVEQVVDKERRSSQGFSLFKPRISAADLALLTRQLATLVESALPIEEALFAVAEQCEKPSQKNMMMAVRSKVVEGHGLADSMAEFPNIFDDLYRAMVAAGEKSGHLDTVLNRLADYTERRQQVKSQVTQAMIYPSIMLLVALGIVGLLLSYVVPRIVGQFDRMGQELPGVTQLLIAISEAVQNYGLWGLGLIAVLILAYKQMMRNPALKLRADKQKLGWPVFGKVMKSINTSRFASTLSILTASAIPLLEGMRIAGQVLDNLHMQNLVKDAAQKVQEGSTLRAALEQTKVFPPMMMHMIASGEKSGELQDMLGRAALNEERAFEAQVNIALAIMGPVMILSMAGIVFFIVIAILLPIINLNSFI